MIDDSAARRLPDPPAQDPFNDEALSDDLLHTDPALREVHDSLLRDMSAQAGLYLLTGDDGLGKTALLRSLAKSLRGRGNFVSLLPGETLAVSDLLLDLSLKAGIAPPVPKGIADWLARFHAASAGVESRSIFVVIVDGADNVADDILDGLAALLFQSSGNSGTLRLLLGGRPEFADRLARPTHATLHQALVNHFRLGLLAAGHIDILARIADQVQEAMQQADAVRRDVDPAPPARTEDDTIVSAPPARAEDDTIVSAPPARTEDDTIVTGDRTIPRPMETNVAPILSEATKTAASSIEASRAIAVRPNAVRPDAPRWKLRPVLACLVAAGIVSALLFLHPFSRPAVEPSNPVDASADAVELRLASSSSPAKPLDAGTPVGATSIATTQVEASPPVEASPVDIPKVPDAPSSAADYVTPPASALGGISVEPPATPSPQIAPPPAAASAWETPTAEVADPLPAASNAQPPAQSIEARSGEAQSPGGSRSAVASEASNQDARPADIAPPPAAASSPVDDATASQVKIAAAAAPTRETPPPAALTETTSPPRTPPVDTAASPPPAAAAAPEPIPSPTASKTAQATAAAAPPPSAPAVDTPPASPPATAPEPVPPPTSSKTALATVAAAPAPPSAPPFRTAAPEPVPPPSLSKTGPATSMATPAPPAPAAGAPAAPTGDLSQPQRDALAQPLPANVIAILMRRGDELMDLRDIAGARLLFERAAMAGNARAAMMAGKTYDPAYFREAGVIGVPADRTKALQWYRRAVSLGSKEASARIQALGN